MSTRTLGRCLVCDDEAIGINFAVPTCAPCKAFFRRNAVKLGRRDFICQHDGDCPVTYRSRRLCNCCRLAKCFRIGMQKSLIRSEAEREARKQLVEQNRRNRSQTLSKTSSALIRPSNLLMFPQSQPQSISPSDQTLLTNICSAYERTCIAAKVEQSPSFPSLKRASVHTLLNDYTERQKAVVKYFKLIPEFDQLSMCDKIRLIRNHFCITLSINEATLSSDISPKLMDSIAILFKPEISSSLAQSIKLLHSYNTDRMLLKILLIIKSLSSGINRFINEADMDQIYEDTLAVFAAQNIYVELLWRYLLSRFPSELYAIKFYNKLIRELMFVQRVCFMTESYIYSLTNEIQQMNPLIKSMWPISNPPNIRDTNVIEID
ncbi:unnamed protein product [Rotaria magnacalcarata]|uniref:Uncharacterized protein n=3 Tax=Rotaria magnacalcarata TaxID=392030 RepID=A0A815SJG7_9BILA|nr:unnamed protein product [Rotaria magnacalcarata]CAF1673947.1 unnamed protein product [Rotaria magnacalcarata]CAF2153201.1 unnamed protein product [Rotaria magnacalcarata]